MHSTHWKLVTFAVPCWFIGLHISGVNPYLVLTLAIAGSSCSAATGVIATLAIGWVAESLGMTAIGSASGPLMLAFASVRWARDQFFWGHFGLRVAAFLAAACIYYISTLWIAHGAVDSPALWGPSAVGHALLGLAAAGCLDWWVRVAMWPWGRTRLQLGE